MIHGAFTYYVQAVSLICLLKNQFFGIVFSHGFAVYHMNNTSFITKVKRSDSFKAEKLLSLSCCNAIQSHAKIIFFLGDHTAFSERGMNINQQ